MKVLVKFAIAAAAISGLCGHSHAQAPKAKNNAAPVAQTTPAPNTAAAEGANTPAPPGWVARCSSASRGAPLECAIEQSAVLTKTGQLIVLINIRVSAETRAPIALVQLPLGLNLPAGAKIQVDEGKTSELQIQTCEARGCYANLQISPDVLAALKSGKQLKVSFQNMGKETISIRCRWPISPRHMRRSSRASPHHCLRQTPSVCAREGSDEAIHASAPADAWIASLRSQ